YDDEEYVTRLLQAGASGYVLKRSAATELAAAVRAARAGEAFLYPSIARRVIDDYLRRLDRTPATAGLTPREREILGYIVEGRTPGKVGVHEAGHSGYDEVRMAAPAPAVSAHAPDPAVDVDAALVVMVGIDHVAAPLAVRERLAAACADLPSVIAHLRAVAR